MSSQGINQEQFSLVEKWLLVFNEALRDLQLFLIVASNKQTGLLMFCGF